MLRAAPPRPAGAGATVWLRAGLHARNATFELGTADSGTSADAPVEYRAWPGECVSLQTGQNVAAAAFEDLTPAERARLHPNADPTRVRALDLAPLGISVPAWSASWTEPGLLSVVTEGVRQNMSQYPNGDGWMEPKAVWATGAGANESHPVFEYKTNASTLTGPTRHLGQEAVWAAPGGAVERGLWFAGYWRVAWSYEALRVSAINTTTHMVSIEATPNCGLGDKYSCHLDCSGKSPIPVPCSYAPGEPDLGRVIYKALNLLEEIDVPGEWSVDFGLQRLYFYFPRPVAEAAPVQLAANEAPLIVLNNASNVRLAALGFEHSRGTAVTVFGGNNVQVSGCVFNGIDADAVVVKGGHRHVVRSNNLHDLGQSGVVVTGGSVAAPSGHVLDNNHVFRFAQIVRVYESAFTVGTSEHTLTTVGVNVTHNRIHDGPHMGVQFGGFFNHFELNDVSRWSQVSNDIGCFYAFSYRTAIHGNQFLHNYCHDGNDGDGMYFDFDQDADLLEGNLVVNVNRAYLHKCSEGNSTVLLKGNVALNASVGFTVLSAGALSVIESNIAVGCAGGGFDVHGSFDAAANAVIANASDVQWNGSALLSGLVLADTSPLLAQFRDLHAFPLDQVGLYEDEFRTPLDLCTCLADACNCKPGFRRLGPPGLGTTCQRS